MSTYSQESKQARIDIDGTNNTINLTLDANLQGGWGTNASWFDDDAKNKEYVLVIFQTTDNWSQSSFSFLPTKDGEVSLILRSRWIPDKTKEEEEWTLFDNIVVEGAEIKNGNFEEGNSSWNLNGNSEIVTEGKQNNKCVKVSHDSPAIQNMTVNKDKKVKITFQHKISK
ncbi:MAG TPA: hypothetical protein P5270_02085 [Victivallales bacterium]|nr:hypothetical protein [Victivallales bacterium]HRR28128.1 hypothetical protein [Victivallales bacterium]HRU01430.1 hypothetical protein [Victivallales bacterium]